MVRTAQVGVALSILGAVLTFMSLFPGVTGIQPASGIGLVQIFGILIGFGLLIAGALVFVKFTFYINQPNTLLQQIGIRLSLTGLVLAALAGLADTLGFGSHPPIDDVEPIFGTLQAAGMVGSLMIASVGVLVYAIFGVYDDVDIELEPDIEIDEAERVAETLSG